MVGREVGQREATWVGVVGIGLEMKGAFWMAGSCLSLSSVLYSRRVSNSSSTEAMAWSNRVWGSLLRETGGGSLLGGKGDVVGAVVVNFSNAVPSCRLCTGGCVGLEEEEKMVDSCCE